MGRLHKPKYTVPTYRLSPRVRERLVRMVQEKLAHSWPDLYTPDTVGWSAEAEIHLVEVYLAGLPPTERKRVVQTLHQVADTGDSEEVYDLVVNLARRGYKRFTALRPRFTYYGQRHRERLDKRLARRS